MKVGQAEKGRSFLLGMLDTPLNQEAFNWLKNVLGRMELTTSIPKGWAAGVLDDPKAPAFKKDYARLLRGEKPAEGNGKKPGPKSKTK